MRQTAFPPIGRLCSRLGLVACFLLAPTRQTSATEPPRAGLFNDSAAQDGLDFVHFIGATGSYYFPEITGAGLALLDFDRDGDLDVYLSQGEMIGPSETVADSLFPPPAQLPLSDRLFRNDRLDGLEGGSGVRFVDVTARSGVPAGGYGMGAAVNDFDGDGWPDLYVTNYGPNRLLRNQGDGRFEDVTAASGADDPRWSVSAAFVDFDRDGWPDLYVGNYVDFSPTKQVPCLGNTGVRDYCDPDSYEPLADRLFRNRGDGTFEDATGQAGLSRARGAALGVVATDLTGDGWVDIYVANDGMANRLWVNRGDGTFGDEALLRGCAVNSDGQPEASMGVDVADFDSDGDEDLFMTHLRRETNTLYVNDGSGNFVDRSNLSGLGTASWKRTGFGTAWFDYDNDGLLDILVANGAVTALDELRQQRDPYPYHEPNQLYRNTGDGRFTDVTAMAGPGFAFSEVSRGAAFGDLDGDGDTDVVLLNNNGPARLLWNEVGAGSSWIGLQLAMADGRVDEIGALVSVRVPSGDDWRRRTRRAAGFASSNDPRVLVGLGQATVAIAAVEIERADGRRQRWRDVPIRKYLTLYPPTPAAGGRGAR